MGGKQGDQGEQGEQGERRKWRARSEPTTRRQRPTPSSTASWSHWLQLAKDQGHSLSPQSVSFCNSCQRSTRTINHVSLSLDHGWTLGVWGRPGAPLLRAELLPRLKLTICSLRPPKPPYITFCSFSCCAERKVETDGAFWPGCLYRT
jgi:hypothetical protein